MPTSDELDSSLVGIGRAGRPANAEAAGWRRWRLKALMSFHQRRSV
ncbi:MAG TPA: hypothetical protein VN809_01420 [Telmatospirillum sp.]|nr:hypothetical protein [Telmatospirillum sp.]